MTGHGPAGMRSRGVARPALHAAAGFGALLLGVLDTRGAVALAVLLVVHNVLLLPLYAPGVMRPPGPRPDAGVLSYPLVVLATVLLLGARPHWAAAAWAVLAWGDAAAAVAGPRLGGARWPWNPAKRLAGSAAFVLAGSAAGAATAGFVAAAGGCGPSAAALVATVVVAALAAALAESAPSGVDDNVRIGAACGAVFGAAALVDPARAGVALEGVGARLPWALPAAAAAAGAGLAAGALRRSGAGAAFALALCFLLGEGWRGLAVLVAFVSLATAATRAGRVRKESLGIAQPAGGRRGASHALANGGLAAALAGLAPFVAAAPALRLAWVGALATAAFDTVATEAGGAWGRRAWSIPHGRAAAPGTPGAVSLPGSAAGAAAGLAVAAVAAAAGLVRWPLVPWLGLSAAAGSFAESWAAGSPCLRARLGPHARNLLNTALGALLAALAALALPQLTFG